MSLQWTFIATFLYTELFLCALLMLPFISATRWQKIFKSKLLGFFRSYANLYFNIFIVVLIILFVDATIDWYAFVVADLEMEQEDEVVEAMVHTQMFQAQRHFTLSGVALLILFVLRRLVTAISNSATLEANVNSLKKQAESASAVAKQLMEDMENKSNEKEEGAAKKAVDAVSEMELTKLKNELAAVTRDLDTMRKQAESTNREYDRLMTEHSTLQDTCKAMQGSGDDKKDD